MWLPEHSDLRTSSPSASPQCLQLGGPDPRSSIAANTAALIRTDVSARWNLGMPAEMAIALTLAAAPHEPGNDGCQVVRVDGLWHVDLKPSQQRQVCVVLLDERG